MRESKTLNHKQIKRLLENAADLDRDQKRLALIEIGQILFNDRDIAVEDEIERFLKEVEDLLNTCEAVQHFEVDEDEDKTFADIVYLSAEECFLYAPILLSKIAHIEEKYGYDIDVVHQFTEGATFVSEFGAVTLTPDAEELATIVKKGLKGQVDLTETFDALEAKLFKVNHLNNETQTNVEESIDELLQSALPEQLKGFVEFEDFILGEHGYQAKVYISSLRAVRAVSKFLELQSNRLSLIFKKDVTLWVSVVEEA